MVFDGFEIDRGCSSLAPLFCGMCPSIVLLPSFILLDGLVIIFFGGGVNK